MSDKPYCPKCFKYDGFCRCKASPCCDKAVAEALDKVKAWLEERIKQEKRSEQTAHAGAELYPAGCIGGMEETIEFIDRVKGEK